MNQQEQALAGAIYGAGGAQKVKQRQEAKRVAKP
jgi:hypothetical protein